ncbi:MAG: diguanylate cyclase [Woeseiaceae bacterium]|nr:diguanylate cyclase [Woeseiaceae bacterium]
MDASASTAALGQWHEWTSVFAYSILVLLVAFAAVQLVISMNGSWASRLFRNNSLRGSLIVGLALLGAVPVIALGAFLAERSAHERVERIAERMEERARAVSFSIDQFIDKHLSGVASAASAISRYERFDSEQMTLWLLLYHRVYSDFLTMLKADASGNIVTATSNMTGFLAAVPDLEAHNVSDRPYFLEPMRTGQPFVSQVFQGRNLGSDPIVAISAPLRNADNRIVGIIEGSLNLKAFEHMQGQWATLDGAELILTDHADRVIFASASTGYDVLESVADRPLLAASAAAVPGSTFSFVRPAGYDGVRYLGVSVPTGNGWTAHIQVPLDGIYAQIAADYRSAVVLGIAMLLVAFGLAYAILRRITASIADMNTAIDDMDLDADTDSIRTPWSTFAEFRPLFRHLRDRCTDLRKSYRRLNGSIAAGEKLRSALTQVIARKEVEIAERTSDLEEANERLSDLSNRDALTDIPNRRHFESFRKTVWATCENNGSSVAIVLLDIDHFKTFNDRLGHQAGDECLSRVARALSESATRPLDLVARIGGEEFVAVLGETSLQNALIVAGRMRKVVERLAIPHPRADDAVVTLSCGVAAAEPAGACAPSDVMQAADEALYHAKAAGRNRVAYRTGAHFAIFAEDSVKLDATNVLKILRSSES